MQHLYRAENIWYYQLDKDKIIEVQGILGESTIKIEDGFVFFEISRFSPVSKFI